ncbi:NapC/NirT family cytochrome c [Vibrio sp. HN007]|uniref:NapC/NirT family cytochrome c n=1 Tax=Vibrio iocasae TaxID=3098914 RepID=UPI0035D409EB
MNTYRKPTTLALIFSGLIIGLLVTLATKITLEKTSDTEFCISCHSMENAYEEYKKSAHFNNTHGVSAECSDCHIPQDTVEYLVTKVRASKDLYHEFITGKIDTQEKYDAHKLSMAETVWAQMKANDSSTCRSCHDFERMTTSSQKPEAVTAHNSARANNQTCIDCHKGIAHSLPKPKSSTVSVLEANTDEVVYTTAMIPLHNSPELEKSRAKILPLTQLNILKKQDNKVQVELTGWQEAKKKVLYSEKGMRIAASTLRGVKDVQPSGNTYQDPITKKQWKQIQIRGWISDTDITQDLNSSWNNLKFEYESKCGQCHLKVEEGHFAANDWPAQFMGMAKQAKLGKDETQAMLKYLQYHSSSFIEHH